MEPKLSKKTALLNFKFSAVNVSTSQHTNENINTKNPTGMKIVKNICHESGQEKNLTGTLRRLEIKQICLVHIWYIAD